MKKGWKRFWGICGVMFGIGIVCILIAVILGVSRSSIEGSKVGQRLRKSIIGSSILIYDEKTDNSPVQEETVQTYRGIRELDAEIYAGTLEIRRTTEAEVRVETSGMRVSYGFRAWQDEETLELSTQKKISTKNNKSKIIVYLPEDLELQEASLDLGAGVLYIEDIKVGSLDVEIGAGQANLDQFHAGELDVSCGAGQVVLSGEVTAEADLECGTGEIIYHAVGAEEDYNYDLESGIGEISVGSQKISGFGKDKFINNNAYKTIKISCGIGKVSVDFKKK